MIDDSAMPNTTGANGTDVGRSNFRRAVDIFRHSFRPQWLSTTCNLVFLAYCAARCRIFHLLLRPLKAPTRC